MARIVLVHGSIADGATAWSAQEPLEDAYEVVVLERPGSRVGDQLEPMTYADHGAWVASKVKDGDHVVGHSAGAIIAMLAVAASPADIASLTLLEPPAFALAEDDPDARRMADDLRTVWASPPSDPREFLLAFLTALTGEAQELPDPLPAPLEHGARRLQLEQGPWEVAVPTAELAERRIATMLVTGGWSPALDAVAAALVQELRATSKVLPGAGHDIQRAPGCNEALARFISSSERQRYR